MLDGFVVPHAHYRVFHGNAAAESTGHSTNDQMALLFRPSRAAAAPTDLHVREFVQLEAHVKALQQQQLQQQQQYTVVHPTSRLMEVAQSAPLAECFSFYARLMTPESFTWPDFLAIVFGKLTDHFIASDCDLVRKAILDVFRASRAHLARVADGAKITTLIRGLLDRHDPAGSRVWILQLVETMPTLAVGDSSIRSSILRSLTSDNAEEKQVAVEAALAMLPLSSNFRQAVLSVVVSSRSAILVVLAPLALEEEDQHAAEQVWNLCASLFHDQVTDEAALQCLHAAGSIVAKFPETTMARHMQLIRYVTMNDPRSIVAANMWSTCQVCVHRMTEPAIQESFFDIVMLQLQPESSHSVTSSAIRILSSFCASHGQVPGQVVECARKIASRTSQHQRLFIQLLSRCAHWELVESACSRPEDDSRTLLYVNELVQFLSSRQFIREQRVWMAAMTALKELTVTFPELLGNFVGECYLQLVRSARHKNLARMEMALWLALSHICTHCPQVISKHGDLFDDSKITSHDSKTRQAISIFLVAGSTTCSDERRNEWLKKCLLLTHDSDYDRYTVARVAMCQGSSRHAICLLKPVVDAVDNDVYGSWLRALVVISEAFVVVESEQLVTFDAHHRLADGKALLQAGLSLQSGFDFQIAFINARIRWMELMLQAQQYAGEIAHTGRSGGVREHRLSENFRTNAEEFQAIRSKMLCATSSDRTVLTYFAQISFLIASAAMQFLLPDQPMKLQTPVNGVSTRPSSARFGSHFRTLVSLNSDIEDKAGRLKSLDVARRPLVGSTIFVQLLRVVCTFPPLMPAQFFRSQAQNGYALQCNMQFLTEAEATSTPSKPRTRSQLGVAVGTEFRSSLHGTVVFPRASAIRSTASAIHVTVTLAVEKAAVSGIGGLVQTVCDVTIPVAKSDVSSEGPHFAPIEAPIVVSSDLLKSKGTYTIHAAAQLIDSNGEAWALATTGGHRGIIVY